jgi:hypothetical protein
MQKVFKKKDKQRILRLKDKYPRLSEYIIPTSYTKGEKKSLKEIKKILLKLYPDLNKVIRFDNDRKGVNIKCLVDYNYKNNHEAYYGVYFIEI